MKLKPTTNPFLSVCRYGRTCIASIAILCACTATTDDPSPDQDGDSTFPFEITATIEPQASSNGTRVGFDPALTTDSGYALVWQDDDAVSLLGSNTSTGEPLNARFDISAGAGSGAATFTGNLPEGMDAPSYAVFPYSSRNRITESGVRIPLDQRKYAMQDNISRTALSLVGQVCFNEESEPVVDFVNIMGLLKITLKNTTLPTVSIKKIALHDLGGNLLWGDCVVPFGEDGTLDVDNIRISNGDNTVNMVWNTPFNLSKYEKSFYFPVPPNTLGDGFSLVFYEYDSSREDGIGRVFSVVQKVTNPVAVRRNSSVEMSPMDVKEKSESLDENARGYYKSLFVDGGLFLSGYCSEEEIPALEYLSLADDYEYFESSSTSALNSSSSRLDAETSVQNGVMVSAPGDSGVDWSDDNGVLLYPDGEPRFRTLFVNGGTSYNHGETLTRDGRVQIRQYVKNGGSYVGSCAGAFLACTSIDGTDHYSNASESENWSFGIWPGNMNHTHLPINMSTYPAVYTSMKVLPAMKELDLFGFAARDTIEDVHHHGGGYLNDDPVNNAIPHEELLSYQYSDNSFMKTSPAYEGYLPYLYMPSNSALPQFVYKGAFVDVVDEVGVFAYKESSKSGRAVLCGSHPEICKDGSKRDLMAAMLVHSMNGNGEPEVKATLRFGVPREMKAAPSDGRPEFAGIGDRQYHHFKIEADHDVDNFVLALDSDYDAASGIDLFLALRKGGLAWISDADYVLCNKGGKKRVQDKESHGGHLVCQRLLLHYRDSHSYDSPSLLLPVHRQDRGAEWCSLYHYDQQCP